MLKKNLSTSSMTEILIENIPEDDSIVQELIKWRQQTHINDSDLISIGSEKKNYKVLSQIEAETEDLQNEKKYFDVRAYIAHVKSEANLYYLACANSDKCLKKVTEVNGGTRFSDCYLNYYRISL